METDAVPVANGIGAAAEATHEEHAESADTRTRRSGRSPNCTTGARL